MLEPLKEGFLGFFLVLGQWLSPGTDKADIRLTALHATGQGYSVQCALVLAWNGELGALVDAGIPLRFRMSAASDAGDTLWFVRTLHFDIADYTYSFSDSSGPNAKNASVPKKYPQILLALRDFARWNVTVSEKAATCRVEAEMLPSRAARLGRTVDMSALWGQKKIAREIALK
jgi:hypothetical protein